jgi:energy-coupling factor transporter transmembrane protein EcfT
MSQIEATAPQGQAHSREWVRSFLFSVRIDSPLSKLHVASKLFAILALSLVVVQFINTDDPDPVGAVLMIVLAFLGLYLCGVLRWVFHSYVLVMFPGLFGMALVWIVFNSDPGSGVLARVSLYSGHFNLGISLGIVLFVAFAVGYYVIRKNIFWGIVGGIVLAVAVTRLFGNPSLTFTQLAIGRPFEIALSLKSIVVALTKTLGYAAMILVSLLLVMTTRDVELTGMMRQMRVNYVASFFVATMLRSLNLALNDYSTIRQAQIARGISLKKRTVFRVLSDLANMAVPLTATMLRRSTEVGDAALLRGFTMQSKNPTEFYEVRPFAAIDWVVIGVCLALVVFVVGLRVNITTLLGVTL